jgi:hypothetical protein
MSNAERIVVKNGQGERCHRCDRRFGLIRHHFASEQFCSKRCVDEHASDIERRLPHSKRWTEFVASRL